MKALPDEEGIETFSGSWAQSLASGMKALPDEEGIETVRRTTSLEFHAYEGTP